MPMQVAKYRKLQMLAAGRGQTTNVGIVASDNGTETQLDVSPAGEITAESSEAAEIGIEES